MTVSVKSALKELPTYLPTHIWKGVTKLLPYMDDPQVPTYLTYLPTYHPNLMAPIVRPPDVFLWSWTSSMPFLWLEQVPGVTSLVLFRGPGDIIYLKAI